MYVNDQSIMHTRDSCLMMCVDNRGWACKIKLPTTVKLIYVVVLYLKKPLVSSRLKNQIFFIELESPSVTIDDDNELS